MFSVSRILVELRKFADHRGDFIDRQHHRCEHKLEKCRFTQRTKIFLTAENAEKEQSATEMGETILCVLALPLRSLRELHLNAFSIRCTIFRLQARRIHDAVKIFLVVIADRDLGFQQVDPPLSDGHDLLQRHNKRFVHPEELV